MSNPTPPSSRLPLTTPHDVMEDCVDRVTQLNDPNTRVCQQCVTDTHLWASVAEDAENADCDFCGTTTQVVTFENLAVVVEGVLGDLYLSAEESGAYHDDGEWSETVEDVQVILDDLLNGAVENDVSAPLVAFIAERNAVDHGFVLQRDVWASLYDFHEGAWRHFMTQARDGNITTAAQNFLTVLPADVIDLFRRIVQVAELEGLFKHAAPLLWRCRPGTSEVEYKAGVDIGSPPAEWAGDGRLNAMKQSVFYGSTTLRGAVIEMVNHHGEDVELWAGQFTPSRRLYHLDVMEPPPLPSPFAPGAADTHDAILFLGRFAATIRQPKSGEPRHYLPTQIFVAFLLAAHEDLRPDAIRYGSSVDPKSENWVVFADHDHCGDLGTTYDLPADEVFMLLDQSTAQFVVARQYLQLGQPRRGPAVD